MSAGNWVRLVMVIAGVSTMWMTLLSLAKRKFTDGFSMVWGMLSACMFLGGILLDPSGISAIMSDTALVLLMIAGAGAMILVWNFSREISSLERKNYELAMQLSLLNQEQVLVQKLLSREEIQRILRDMAQESGGKEAEKEENAEKEGAAPLWEKSSYLSSIH